MFTEMCETRYNFFLFLEILWASSKYKGDGQSFIARNVHSVHIGILIRDLTVQSVNSRLFGVYVDLTGKVYRKQPELDERN